MSNEKHMLDFDQLGTDDHILQPRASKKKKKKKNHIKHSHDITVHAVPVKQQTQYTAPHFLPASLSYVFNITFHLPKNSKSFPTTKKKEKKKN